MSGDIITVSINTWTNTPQQTFMIPRFSNPHLLQSTKVITRAELDAEYEEDCLKEDSKTIEQLHLLLDNSSPIWDVSDIASSKRRKVEENDEVQEEPVRMCSF
jgi:hypothetical protein